MNRAEFSEIWGDWLKGVAVAAALVVLAALYFLDLVTGRSFAMVLAVATGIMVFGVSVDNCMCRLLGPKTRLLSFALIITAGGLLTLSVYNELTPGFMVLEGELSPSEPVLDGYVPTAGELVMDVQARPGIRADGADAKVTARISAAYRGYAEGVFHEIGESRKWAFLNTVPGGGKSKNKSSPVTSAKEHFEGAVEGPFHLVLEEMKPEMATPLKVRVYLPWVHPTWIRMAAILLGVLSLLLAPFFARAGVFPSHAPATIVLAAAAFAVTTGLPQGHPEPRLFGIVLASAFGGALVGYLACRAIMVIFPAPKSFAQGTGRARLPRGDQAGGDSPEPDALGVQAPADPAAQPKRGKRGAR